MIAKDPTQKPAQKPHDSGKTLKKPSKMGQGNANGVKKPDNVKPKEDIEKVKKQRPKPKQPPKPEEVEEQHEDVNEEDDDEESEQEEQTQDDQSGAEEEEEEEDEGEDAEHAQVNGEDEEEDEEDEQDPLQKVIGNTVDDQGNVVDDDNNAVGKVTSGKVRKLVGLTVGDGGAIRNSKGKVVGHADATTGEDGAEEEEESDGEQQAQAEQDKAHKVQAEPKGQEQQDRQAEAKPQEEAQQQAQAKEEEEEDDSPIVEESGYVVDETGTTIGKLTKGNRHKLAGCKVDEDGNVLNKEGKKIGKAELYPPEKSEEEKKAEQDDRKIASQMNTIIEDGFGKIQPILKMITERIEAEEKKPKEERDEEDLVKAVRPLIEEGSNILGEINGAIRDLDPTGRVAKKVQHRQSEQKASDEEHRLANNLSKLAGEISQTIEKAKKLLQDMPKAEEKLNPLWALLQNPLLQILAAVGLLLSGVLGLVGNLLNGLGLGGLVNNLLGGLGLDKILGSLGLGLGGKTKKK
ncbi:hypothetical protein BZG36_01798 [Bifiguratus adelaidae]|uniref:DUF6987 domain-containing protein n=1 Tax=Bifiguratus adelaidae TaxID=1938954 RepID=A0A261Y2D3_9FUNG|nr:hypothetical protein BZG36_01798 [Bifiguratus adelaidae]